MMVMILGRSLSGVPERLRLALCFLPLLSLAQEPVAVRIRTAAWYPPELVISTDSNLVELVAIVRDDHHRPVSGLPATDFEVLDNNQPRALTFFLEQKTAARHSEAAYPTAQSSGRGSDDPTLKISSRRSIALFFDDIHASMAGVRTSAQAATRLITNVLSPSDEVGIYTASSNTTVEFSANRKPLLAALAGLDARQLSGVRATVSCPTLGPSEAYIITQHLDIDIENAAVDELVACNCNPPSPGCREQQRAVAENAAQNAWQQYAYLSTATLDTLFMVMRQLARRPGDRLLILMSPGFPTGGMEDRTNAIIDTALHGNIRINSLNSEGLVTERLLSRKLFLLSGFMADSARSTGGKYLHDTNDMSGSLRSFTEAPQISYLLGFSPPGNPDGKYHVLKVRVRRTGLRVESRPGYFAAEAETKTEPVQQRMDRIAQSAMDIKEFPVTLEAKQESLSGSGATLQVKIEVDANSLRFAEKGDRKFQELTFLTVIEDGAGDFVSGKQSVMDIAPTPSGLQEIKKKGIRAVTSFPVSRKGSYRVREVVREIVENRIWASTTLIETR